MIVEVLVSNPPPWSDPVVATWVCEQLARRHLEDGDSTCADGVDVDHVRTTDGQWWKLPDTVRAEVRPGGEVAFYSRGSGRRLFEPADDLSTRWGKVSECGKDFGH